MGLSSGKREHEVAVAIASPLLDGKSPPQHCHVSADGPKKVMLQSFQSCWVVLAKQSGQLRMAVLLIPNMARQGPKSGFATNVALHNNKYSKCRFWVTIPVDENTAKHIEYRWEEGCVGRLHSFNCQSACQRPSAMTQMKMSE